MDRSVWFVRGLLTGVGLVVTGMAVIACGAHAAQAVRRRARTAPNYAYLR